MLEVVVDNPLVSFQNKGLIEEAAITTLGVNVKEGSNPIGYFGTGLKYAISIILRNGGSISIWKGFDEYIFETKRVSIRGKEFDIVTMNGKDLGFTTEMGKNWKMWQAFREIYCNTLDEDGIAKGGFLEPKEGFTTIHVRSAAFLRAYNERNLIVLNSEEICISMGIRIHPYIASSIHYRGIKVKELTPKTVYTYNIVGQHIELTEDRTAANMFDVRNLIISAIGRCTNKEVIKSVIKAPEDSWEAKFDFQWTGDISQEFKEVVEECFTNKESINDTAIKACRDHLDFSKTRPPRAILSGTEQIRLEYCIAVCEEAGLSLKKYEIYMVDQLDSNIWGMADRTTNTIYLPRKLLSQSPASVISTIMEEYVHLDTGYSDGSRSMQSHLGELWAKNAIRIHDAINQA